MECYSEHRIDMKKELKYFADEISEIVGITSCF